MNDHELGEGKTCFIVGPIGDRLSPVGTAARLSYESAIQMWEQVFEPACAVFHLLPVRADKISESGDIPEQIFTYLRDADVVIADVTGGNANVMYELGLRHTRDGKVTIQIGENERLPFDVTTIRTIKFQRTEAGLIDARNSLIESLRVALQGGGSPVTATRIWNDLGSLQPEDVARASALSATSDDPADQLDEEEPGTLELMAQGEVALERVGEVLETFSEQMVLLGAVSQDYAPKLQAAESFAAKLTIVKKFADELQATADEMSGTSGEFLQYVGDIDTLVSIAVEQAREEEEELASEATEFFDGLRGAAAGAAGAQVQFVDVLATVRQMRKWSTLLRPVSKSLEHSINTIIAGSAIVAGWGDLLDDDDAA